jgi:type IV pilus assembly protein PilF
MRSLLIAALLLAACVPQEAKKPETQQSQDARYRAQVHTDLAANYFARQQYGIALDELKEAQRSDPNFVPAYNMLGLTHMQLKQDEAAQESFAAALKLAPKDPDVNNNYGWFLCNRGREAESIDYFLVSAKDPLYSTPHKPLTNAGICSRKIGNEAQAEEYFRKALRLAPDDAAVNYQLAEINYRRNNLPQAKLHLLRALEFSGAGAEALWLAVRIERKLGNGSAEGSYALRLKSRYPESREARLLANEKYD